MKVPNKQNQTGQSPCILCQFFTISDIETHRLSSGKQKGAAIAKTLDRGRKFKEERYLSSDTIYTKHGQKHFLLKHIVKQV